MTRSAWRFTVTAVALLYTTRATAADTFGLDAPSSSPPAAAGTEQAVIARYWELGRNRAFLAASLEAGFAYLRPRFAAGYGRPFWFWVGAEAYPMLSLNSLGQYVGIAAEIPGLTFRAGGRYHFPFSRSFLEPQESFERLDLDVRRGPRADYVAFEAELTGTVPVAYGSLFAIVSAYRTTLVPDDYFLFEESLRVVMKPPYAYRARAGYLLAFGTNGAIRLGPVAEFIGLPGRDEYVVRGGVLGSVLISARLEAQASLIPVWISPDQLGLSGGDFGQLGIRFRWATGATPDPNRVRQRVESERQRHER